MDESKFAKIPPHTESTSPCLLTKDSKLLTSGDCNRSRNKKPPPPASMPLSPSTLITITLIIIIVISAIGIEKIHCKMKVGKINNYHEEDGNPLISNSLTVDNDNVSNSIRNNNYYYKSSLNNEDDASSSSQDNKTERASSNELSPTSQLEATSNFSMKPREYNAWQAAQLGLFRYPKPICVIIFIAYSLVFIVGIVGNSFVVTIVCKSPKMRTVTNIFIANLALADILVLVLCLPATLIGNIFVPWVLGLFVCKAVSYLQGVAVSASINTMVAVTVDRFCAICFPMGFHLSRRNARRTIAAIWFFSLVIALPWALFFDLIEFEHGDDKLMSCQDSWPDGFSGSLYFVVANLIMLYLLPAAIILLCYIGILIKLNYRSIPGDRPIDETTGKDTKIELIMNRSKLKVVKMMMVVVCTFLASWGPLYLIWFRLKLMANIGPFEEDLIRGIMPIAQWLGAMNSCINPILYTFFNRRFKRSFIDLFTFGLCFRRRPLKSFLATPPVLGVVSSSRSTTPARRSINSGNASQAEQSGSASKLMRRQTSLPANPISGADGEGVSGGAGPRSERKLKSPSLLAPASPFANHGESIRGGSGRRRTSQLTRNCGRQSSRSSQVSSSDGPGKKPTRRSTGAANAIATATPIAKPRASEDTCSVATSATAPNSGFTSSFLRTQSGLSCRSSADTGAGGADTGGRRVNQRFLCWPCLDSSLDSPTYSESYLNEEAIDEFECGGGDDDTGTRVAYSRTSALTTIDHSQRRRRQAPNHIVIRDERSLIKQLAGRDSYLVREIRSYKRGLRFDKARKRERERERLAALNKMNNNNNGGGGGGAVQQEATTSLASSSPSTNHPTRQEASSSGKRVGQLGQLAAKHSSVSQGLKRLIKIQGPSSNNNRNRNRHTKRNKPINEKNNATCNSLIDRYFAETNVQIIPTSCLNTSSASSAPTSSNRRRHAKNRSLKSNSTTESTEITIISNLNGTQTATTSLNNSIIITTSSSNNNNQHQQLQPIAGSSGNDSSSMVAEPVARCGRNARRRSRSGGEERSGRDAVVSRAGSTNSSLSMRDEDEVDNYELANERLASVMSAPSPSKSQQHQQETNIAPSSAETGGAQSGSVSLEQRSGEIIRFKEEEGDDNSGEGNGSNNNNNQLIGYENNNAKRVHIFGQVDEHRDCNANDSRNEVANLDECDDEQEEQDEDEEEEEFDIEEDDEDEDEELEQDDEDIDVDVDLDGTDEDEDDDDCNILFGSAHNSPERKPNKGCKSNEIHLAELGKSVASSSSQRRHQQQNSSPAMAGPTLFRIKSSNATCRSGRRKSQQLSTSNQMNNDGGGGIATHATRHHDRDRSRDHAPHNQQACKRGRAQVRGRHIGQSLVASGSSLVEVVMRGLRNVHNIVPMSPKTKSTPTDDKTTDAAAASSMDADEPAPVAPAPTEPTRQTDLIESSEPARVMPMEPNKL